MFYHVSLTRTLTNRECYQKSALCLEIAHYCERTELRKLAYLRNDSDSANNEPALPQVYLPRYYVMTGVLR